MSFLFEITDNIVSPKPEVLLIYPFNEIWDRDESPHKVEAKKEFAYIEFMTSMLKSNPYRDYEEVKKEIVIRKEVVRIDDWRPDDLVRNGIRYLEEKQEELISYRYWLSNKIALEKLIEFFNEFDINERNPKTLNPIYKPKDITSATTDAEKNLSMINNLKKKVDEDVYESLKTKGSKEVSPFAMRRNGGE